MLTIYKNNIYRGISLSILICLLCFFKVVNASNVTENVTSAIAANNIKMQSLNSNKNILLSMTLDKVEISFELVDNTSLLNKNSTVLRSDSVRFLKGKITGNDGSWARFTLNGKLITGAYFDGNSLYIVKSLQGIRPHLENGALIGEQRGLETSDFQKIVIFNANDIKSNSVCALHDHSSSEFFNYDNFSQELKDVASAAAGKQIFITLVADTQYVGSGSEGEATIEMLSELNFADGIFSSQLDITLTEEESFELSDNGDFTSTDAETLLISFRNSPLFAPALRHLFTGRDLDGGTVGIAYIARLCSPSAAGLTQRLSSLTGLIFTHELGHNFGSLHDADNMPGNMMYPNINNGGNTFSQMSIDQINPVIDSASCVIELGSAPEITSSPNETGVIAEVYSYDSDGILDVLGTAPFTYLLDIAPDGMTVTEDGLIQWTPTNANVGVNPVQITVQNDFGTDTQFFEITVESDFIDFSATIFNSYGGSQDANGGQTVGETGFEFTLAGNTWKSIPFDYSVTSNTVIEFEFSSTNEGEIHGIGFDNNNSITSDTTFNVFGTQSWGIHGPQYIGGGQSQLIRINVGAYYTGNFDRLIFVMDNDKTQSGSNSIFSNVRVFEDTSQPPTVDFLDLGSRVINSFLPGVQDVEGTLELTNDGAGIQITGNSWKKIVFENIQITQDTVLTFEFATIAQGEIHGIGFYPSNSVDSRKTFKVFGSQNWGIQDFTYTGNGSYQQFTIPIGTYFTQDQVNMVFVNDHDVTNPTASSNFKNIAIYQPNQ